MRADLHDVLGRLLTQCHEMAASDPTCAQYWQGEALYWEMQHTEALKLVDTMLAAAAHKPAQPSAQTVTVGDIHATGDVTITVIRDSSEVAAGKQIQQGENEQHNHQTGQAQRE